MTTKPKQVTKKRSIRRRRRVSKNRLLQTRKQRVAKYRENNFDDDELNFAYHVAASRIDASPAVWVVVTSANHRFSVSWSLPQVCSSLFLKRKLMEAALLLPAGHVLNPIKLVVAGSYEVVRAFIAILATLPTGFPVGHNQVQFVRDIMTALHSSNAIDAEELVDTAIAFCCHEKLVSCLEELLAGL